jgi:sugar fermentation stimulation protein A
VEVKSVTFAENGTGKFPDAPSGRAVKHLLELARLSASGARACAVFIAQREDLEIFKPYEEIDPLFSETLRTVHDQGVEIFAYRCKINLRSISISRELTIDLCT